MAGTADATGGFWVSYGLNFDLARHQFEMDPVSGEIVRPAEGFGRAALTTLTKTILFFEVSNGGAVLSTRPHYTDCSVVGNAGMAGSGQSDGKGGTLTDPTYPITSSSFSSFPFALYATGNVGGRRLNGATKAGKILGGGSTPRHAGGANYVACDGHAVWLRPEEVSGGNNAAADNPQKAEVNRAAGTAGGGYVLTFSRN